MSSSLSIAPGPALAVPVGKDDHLRGGASARVTLLEYGDFECPQCAEAYPVLKELEDKLGDQLQFAFRHFPITSAHPHAQRAAEASEWAAAQGRFWAMHDALYRRRAKLSEAVILEVAEEIGLDPAGVRHAWTTHAHFQRIKDDFRGGLRSEVAGTPTFFIQGTRYDGRWDGDNLERALAATATPI
jgi:protein-disulfide isomerase